MVTNDDIRRILDLETADFETLEGITEMQSRVEKAQSTLTAFSVERSLNTLSDGHDPLDVLDSVQTT